jgi:hypothetical protein
MGRKHAILKGGFPHHQTETTASSDQSFDEFDSLTEFRFRHGGVGKEGLDTSYDGQGFLLAAERSQRSAYFSPLPTKEKRPS